MPQHWRQVKALTGHISDSVVQEYIDTEEAMKLTVAHATAIRPPVTSVPPPISGIKRPASATTDSTVAPQYNITLNITGDVSAPLSLLSS